MPRVVHFEIHAEQPERAIRFYSKVFAWQFKAWDGPMPYWLIKTGEPGQPGIDGGLVKRHGPSPAEGQAVNAFVCMIEVSSVDDYAGLVLGNGGQVVVPKMPIPGVGWLAFAKDTEGNILGLMQRDAAAK